MISKASRSGSLARTLTSQSLTKTLTAESFSRTSRRGSPSGIMIQKEGEFSGMSRAEGPSRTLRMGGLDGPSRAGSSLKIRKAESPSRMVRGGGLARTAAAESHFVNNKKQVSQLNIERGSIPKWH